MDKFERSKLSDGKLAEMLVGKEEIINLCRNSRKVSDDELCGERIKEIEFEE